MATGNANFKPPTAFLSTVTFHVQKPIIIINLTRHCPLIRHRICKPNTRSFHKLLSFSADAQTQTEYDSIEGNTDSVVSSSTETNEPTSAVLTSLIVYKEAIANNDDAKIAEVELFLKSIENEKTELGQKLEILVDELSNRKAGILSISAEFNNFRKRTESERMSLVSDARGLVLESLLPVVDEFERVTEQIKVENEGEERVNNSYLSIYKQFVEILGSLRDDPVETIDEPSDSMVSTRAGSRFDRAIDEFRQKLNRVYLNFTKTWTRF